MPKFLVLPGLILGLLGAIAGAQERRTSNATAAAAAAPSATTDSASSSSARRESSAALVNSEDHILVPGDLIEVKVFQEPDLDSTLRVSQDGTVVFPLIDRVRVGGMSPASASKAIRDRLDKDYLVGPHVNVRVMEYSKRRFTVLGQVQKPGSYDMPDRDSVNLLEAIGMANGYTRIANPSNVTVKRIINNKENVFKLNAKKMANDDTAAAAFEVKSGDVIMVGESIF